MCLEQLLRDYRLGKAIAHNIPPFCIFGDFVLKQIAMRKPQTVHDLREVKGMGEIRCNRFGVDILSLVRKSLLVEAPRPAFVVMHHGNSQKLRKPTIASVCSKRLTPGIASVCSKRLTPAAALARRAPGISSSTSISARRAPHVNSSRPLVAASRCSHVNIVDKPEDVYILELKHNKVYVGKSHNTTRRMLQHKTGVGSAWTKAHSPTGISLPRLGNVQGSGDASERDETLRYMHLRGVDNVRGWRYTRVVLTEEERRDAEQNIRELFDLCRRCGKAGHFLSKCKCSTDRFGRPIC